MSVTIYVLRHGVAEIGEGKPDEERLLTLEGQQNLQAAARGLRTMGVRWQSIFASPLKRTQQTAEIMRQGVSPELTVTTLPCLAPGHDPADMVQALQNIADVKTALLVGHLPDVVGLVSYLLWGQVTAGFGFHPGTMGRVDFLGVLRPGAGTLRWLLTSEQTQAFGRL